MLTATATANKGAVWQYNGASPNAPWGLNGMADAPFGGGPGNYPFHVLAMDWAWPVLSAAARIVSARLYIWVSGGMPIRDAGSNPYSIGIAATTHAWAEGDPTPPGIDGPNVWMPTGTAANGTWINADCTAWAVDHYGGSPQYKGCATGWFTSLPSGQPYMAGFNTAHSPYIVISFNEEPSVPSLTAPNGGEVVGGLLTATWTPASDSETAQGAIQYQVQLSINGGASWSDVIALTAPGTTGYVFDTRAFGASANCLVRVRAFDGLIYGPWDQSDGPFRILGPGYQMII